MTIDEIVKRINGPLFRQQRELVLELAVGRKVSIVDLDDRELLEGLTGLLDHIADYAHDVHGVDCLMLEVME